MCGFVGFFDNSNNKEVILDKMMNRIYHRGPDMGGKYYDDDAALGFRRLSILDLSEAGGQPLYSHDGNKGTHIENDNTNRDFLNCLW